MTYDLAYARRTALAIIILGRVMPPDMVRDCYVFLERLKMIRAKGATR